MVTVLPENSSLALTLRERMTWREVASFLAARSKKGGFVMSVDQLDAWVRAYLEDVFNGHNLQSLDK